MHSGHGVVLPGHRFVLSAADTMKLDNGTVFGPFQLAYQTYGELNSDKSNAILVCHALTGDQYVAEITLSPESPAGGERWLELENQLIRIGFYNMYQCSRWLYGIYGTAEYRS